MGTIKNSSMLALCGGNAVPKLRPTSERRKHTLYTTFGKRRPVPHLAIYKYVVFGYNRPSPPQIAVCVLEHWAHPTRTGPAFVSQDPGDGRRGTRAPF
jgi:hypothetical protein